MLRRRCWRDEEVVGEGEEGMRKLRELWGSGKGLKLMRKRWGKC